MSRRRYEVRTFLRSDSTQLNWPAELSWDESCRKNVHSARSDSTQLVARWVESDRAL